MVSEGDFGGEELEEDRRVNRVYRLPSEVGDAVGAGGR